MVSEPQRRTSRGVNIVVCNKLLFQSEQSKRFIDLRSEVRWSEVTPPPNDGEDSSDSEETSHSSLFAAPLWLVALKYIMNIKQACHAGSPAWGI